jgi:hypothetical protein
LKILPLFYTVEVTVEELQALLNTLTQPDFQDAFKNGRSTGNGAYTQKGAVSK